MLVIAEDGDDEHVAIRAHPAGTTDQFRAAAVGETEVHDQHVRHGFLGQREGRPERADRTD